MNIFDKFFVKFGYKFPKGYPDMNNEQDILLLESILSELNIQLNLKEAKNPYNNLSDKAKEIADKLIDIFNVTQDNIKASSSNRIIILSDIPRKEVFKTLEDLGYKKDTNIKGSSAGGYRAPNGVEIIHKSESLTKVGGAGVENENIFVDKINYYISLSDNEEIELIIKSNSKKLSYKSVIKAKHVGKEGEKKGWKGDALIYTLSGKIPFSIKKDGPFRWESAMTRYNELYNIFMEKAYNGKIPNLSLISDPNNPKVLQMINTKTETPYGRIFITDVPGLEDQIEDLAFGKDKAIVLQRTFTDNDFNFDTDNDRLIITVSNIMSSVDDIDENDKPIIEFERNASKATQTSGYKGRGIILRISPKERLIKSGPRANNLVLSYNDIIS